MMSHVDIQTALDSHELGITDMFDGALQPASVDLRLGNDMLVKRDGEYVTHWPTWSDDRDNDLTWHLRPGDLYLGSTIERLRIPNTIAAKFEGKSSLGRRGIMTHITAGFIDPGFEGDLTLEITVIGGTETLRPGDKIGQLCFFRLDHKAQTGYGDKRWGSHYQGQTGPTGVRA